MKGLDGAKEAEEGEMKRMTCSKPFKNKTGTSQSASKAKVGLLEFVRDGCERVDGIYKCKM